MDLKDLPNVGSVLHDALLQVGITTPEELRAAGAKAVFCQIREQVDRGACLHMLYGIQGAIDGVRDSTLSQAKKEELKAFFKSLGK